MHADTKLSCGVLAVLQPSLNSLLILDLHGLQQLVMKLETGKG